MLRSECRSRAELIREKPILSLVLLYAICFLACSAAIDLWDLATGDATRTTARYLIPFATALPTWSFLKAWAKTVLTRNSVTSDL